MRLKFRDAPCRTRDDDNPEPIATYPAEQFTVVTNGTGWEVYRKDVRVDPGNVSGTADRLGYLGRDRAHNIRTVGGINARNRRFWSRS